MAASSAIFQHRLLKEFDVPTELASQVAAQVAAHAAATEQEIVDLAGLTARQRGERLLSACRSASRISQSRLAAGLPAEVPAPWPASTWEFLKAKASHVRQSSDA